MELGEKLKQARLEAGLSQRQLCGEIITRNMLSQIEHGTARPSMDTLRYLAGRLGKPLGWFLEEEALTSPNLQTIADARAAFEGGDWQRVISALEDFREPDETFIGEAALLRVAALTELAENAIKEGRLPYARTLLEQAQAVNGPYAPLLRQRLQVLMAKAGSSDDLPRCDEILLIRAGAVLKEGRPERCLTLLAACEEKDAAAHLLSGLAKMELRDFAGAVMDLQAAESAFPKETVPKLEEAFRELGDFKMAYEYACKGRNLP